MVQLVGQGVKGLWIIPQSPFLLYRLRPIQDKPSQGQGRPSHIGRAFGDEILGEHGNLGDVTSHVCDFRIVGDVDESKLQEAVNCWMPDGPVKSLQYMPLHLSEHFVVVERAAHEFELPYGGHVLLAISVFGSNQQGSTTNQLIVSFVHDTPGAIPVEEVDC